jgi:hypothetical protein
MELIERWDGFFQALPDSDALDAIEDLGGGVSDVA